MFPAFMLQSKTLKNKNANLLPQSYNLCCTDMGMIPVSGMGTKILGKRPKLCIHQKEKRPRKVPILITKFDLIIIFSKCDFGD